MAFDDTLFQLGMDLTRSSTAQKEDPNEPARRARETVRKDTFIERDGVRYAGHHLLVDIVGGRRLDDLKHIERTLKRCVEVAKATLLHIHLHPAPHGGVSGVAVVSGGHITFHSRPGDGIAALDLFVSGDALPERCLDVLRVAFDARGVQATPLHRGEIGPVVEPAAAGPAPANETVRARPAAKIAPRPARLRRAA